MAGPAQTETILSASNLRLTYSKHMVLDGATLALYAGQKVGLLGRNGSGKSSFLKIVAGVEQPDEGTVSRKQGLVTGYLPQEFELEPEKTVLENIRAGAADLIAKLDRYEHAEGLSAGEMDRLHAEIDHLDGWNLESRIETLMRKLSAPPADRLVRHLSGGEKRRVGLCRALLAQPDLLVLDEPTNHLDHAAIEWLEGYLADLAGACLFVTHDRYFLDRVATRIVELSEGRFYSHEGNYSDYLIAKAERQEREQAAESKRQSFLRREINWVRAGVKARGTKQRSRLDNYYAVKAQKAPAKELDMDLLIPPPPPLTNTVVDLVGAGVVMAGERLFSNLEISFQAGECVGIVGPNGAGKTTLLRVIMGELEPTEGLVRIGKRTEFNYVDQTRLTLDESKSILEEVSQGSEVVPFGDETIPVRSYLRRFLFSDARVGEPVSTLSGGEKNRVLLAKVLRRGGNFLVLDEPTNDLDLETLRVLEETLVNFAGSSLVVSHDRWFLDRVCDRVIVFDGQGNVTVHVGNYSYFLEKQRERAALASPAQIPASAVSAPSPSAKPRTDKPRKLTWKEERELEGIEATILAAEEEADALAAQLEDPAFYADATNASRANQLHEELAAKQAAVQVLYDRWAELEAIKAAAG
jgi:ATP-binding cassette subfamily F protein uup